MHVIEVNPRGTGRSQSVVFRLALLAFISLCGVGGSRAASLDPGVLPKIQAATFEVVAAKPLNDPLSYEKPLPLDLLPYQERNDKYYSVGTAFALGNNRYATAAHVLQVGIDSLWGEPALRDASGRVYAIDKVEKFSLQQDFAVFSLRTPPSGVAALEVNTKPALNGAVFAVGNALGTGVVIRDGLYTSDTPEDQDGRWKWMRFSAAASPGNSGGPLLDKDGKLIGIVVMKSENENLNYALPINEVLSAPDGQATIDSRGAYQLDLFDTLQNGTFKAQIALPLPLATFYGEFKKHFEAYAKAQLDALLAKESANLFPRGSGSRRLLYQRTLFDEFPTLIVRGSNGEWGRTGSAQQHYALDGNGYVDIGAVGRNGLMHLRRPDSVDAASFYTDATLRMNLLAKTGIFQRRVGNENVKVISLGKPSLETVHVDRWQRPWHVEVWPLPHANAVGVLYALAVPDGYIMLSRFVPVAGVYDARLDMDEMSNFVYVTYEGTLAQWKQFLAVPAVLPAVFKSIRIDFDYGRRFSYASPRVAFAYTPELQAITPDNLLWLGFRFASDRGKPVWDVGDVEVWKTNASDDHNNVNVQRYDGPPAGLDDDMTSRWQKLSQRQYPYNGVARYEDDLMKIDAVMAPVTTDGKPPPSLYTAFYGIEGTHSQADMKAKLDLLMKGLKILEH